MSSYLTKPNVYKYVRVRINLSIHLSVSLHACLLVCLWTVKITELMLNKRTIKLIAYQNDKCAIKFVIWWLLNRMASMRLNAKVIKREYVVLINCLLKFEIWGGIIYIELLMTMTKTIGIWHPLSTFILQTGLYLLYDHKKWIS